VPLADLGVKGLWLFSVLFSVFVCFFMLFVVEQVIQPLIGSLGRFALARYVGSVAVYFFFFFFFSFFFLALMGVLFPWFSFGGLIIGHGLSLSVYVACCI